MTTSEFTDYKYAIMYNCANHAHKCLKRLRNGINRDVLKNDLWNLMLQVKFIEKILEHTLIAEDADCINYFTNEEMKEWAFRLELLQKTAYNVVWDLET